MLTRLQKSRPLQAVLHNLAIRRAERFRKRDPLTDQRRIFARLIAAGSGTRFGKDHGYRELMGLPFEEAYQRYSTRVPIRSYTDFMDDYFYPGQPDRCRPPLLDDTTWPGKIPMYCETSGTTAPTKFIPFSGEMYAENRRAALDMISCYLAANPASRIAERKILYMSGSTSLNEAAPGVWSGDMSALTLRFRPWYLTPFVEPSPRISSLPWDQKLDAMAALLLSDRNIGVISGVPPWILLLLKRCAELGGRPLHSLLPNLELIIHGGTGMAPYRSEFESIFDGRLPHLLELLPSSEAFMGFQQAGEEQMRLTPHYGTFFEFVRFEDLGRNGRPAPFTGTVTLEQVEVGQRYAIILSTCSGLWRYHIGDTIRFRSRDPYLIEFTGRDRFLDKLEEKITQEEVEQAIAELNGCMGGKVREFMVGADVVNRRHRWVLAVKGELDTAFVAITLDQSLRRLNADYHTFRSQGRITPPEVTLAVEDDIYHWSKLDRGKLGGQSKIPHIDPTPDSSMITSLKNFLAHRCRTDERQYVFEGEQA